MVELGCGKTCMKYILFVINFLFFVLGVAAFALGIWALVDKNKMNVLTKVGADGSNFDVVGLLESAAIVLLVSGACIMVMGFLGCWGAFKQSQCLLCLYAIVLVFIVILELAAIIIAATFQGRVTSELKDFLKKNINETYEGDIKTSEEFSLGLDYAQVYFHCCGVDSYTEFAGATKWKAGSGKNLTVPLTCCVLKDDDAYLKDQNAEPKNPNCPTTPTSMDSYKDSPCWSSIESYLKDRISVVIGIAAGILVLEIICIVFACCIISALRKNEV